MMYLPSEVTATDQTDPKDGMNIMCRIGRWYLDGLAGSDGSLVWFGYQTL